MMTNYFTKTVTPSCCLQLGRIFTPVIEQKTDYVITPVKSKFTGRSNR